MLLAGFSVFMFLATPVTNTLIRTNEVEADIWDAVAARLDPEGAARAAS